MFLEAALEAAVVGTGYKYGGREGRFSIALWVLDPLRQLCDIGSGMSAWSGASTGALLSTANV